MEQKGSADLTFEIKDDAFEIRFIEDLLTLGGAEEESATTKVVDLASHTLGVVVNASQETITKDLALASGDAEVVFGVACGFLEVKGFEVEADGNALAEGFVRSETELMSQVGLAEEDEGDKGSGVHLVVEQEAQLVKELRWQEVRFIDDEEDVATFASQVVEGGTELGQEAHKAEGGFDLESEEDFTVKGGDAEVRIGEIDNGVQITVESLSEGTNGGRFTSADIAGEEGSETVVESEGQATLDLAVTT